MVASTGCAAVGVELQWSKINADIQRQAFEANFRLHFWVSTKGHADTSFGAIKAT
jgi:hypothetical protein